MCTLGDIFPWAVLALFLSTGLAAPQTKSTVPVTVNSAESGINNKSVLPCAAPPTVFTSLPFEFWIETIVLGPIPPDFDVLYDPRQGNPVAFQQPIWPFFPNLEISYSTSFVAQTGQPRELFTLYSGRLDNTKRNDAQIWPYPDDDYPGYQPLAWDVEADRDNIQLKFEAYKACSPINEVELRLRARRRNPLSGLSPKEETEMGFSAPETVGRKFFFFDLFPLFSLLKTARIVRSPFCTENERDLWQMSKIGLIRISLI